MTSNDKTIVILASGAWNAGSAYDDFRRLLKQKGVTAVAIVIRLTLMLKKRKDLTDEQFHRHWTHVHGPLVSAWLAGHGVIKYSQYHQPPQYRADATKLWEYLGADSITNWDGHVQLYLPSLDCIANALSNPFYKEVVIPDGDQFISAKSCMRTAGYEECFIMNNRVVEIPPLTGRASL
ncbi:EthD domain-containing protein [Aspergillus avenaceus]|uniref:EthD domain-containing protein n=1 Tax=Aspergillus avenaceus TaxID=36643 RepID=A0A5N6U163_ASPAV|nr:EthD domain-containing protein [Aspergillus avenaceus]